MLHRTQLGRARGLGSAKEGLAHWVALRLTAVALVPLSLWFVVSLISLTGAGHEAVKAWLANPIVAVLMVLLIGAAIHHGQLGLHGIIEDYVHTKWRKFSSVIVLKFAAILLGASCIFAVLKIALSTP